MNSVVSKPGYIHSKFFYLFISEDWLDKEDLEGVDEHCGQQDWIQCFAKNLIYKYQGEDNSKPHGVEDWHEDHLVIQDINRTILTFPEYKSNFKLFFFFFSIE